MGETTRAARSRRDARTALKGARSVPAVLGITELTKAYGPTVAVDQLSLEVRPGQIHGLLGPNGAGKTTTISCLAGLVTPDTGRVVVCGLNARKSGRQIAPLLGVATQHLSLYPTLSVSRNLRFFAQLTGAPSGIVDEGLRWTVEKLGLHDLLARKVAHLSTGQQRLVHVAVALVHRPRLLVLDEPTAGLDVSARAAVIAAVEELAAAGTAVLFSSHYLAEVEQVCSDVTILYQGHVVVSGRVRDLIQKHGGGRIELGVDGTAIVYPGSDLAAAIASVGDVRSLEWTRVIPPSLEAVFLTLTGLRVEASGEVT